MTDPVHKSVLDNGLRVVTIELPHLHTGMIAAYVRAGSRHEDPVRNGVSHFLEHLFFRGSHGYPDGRGMNALVEDCGGSLNGVTTRDHGYYFSPIHPQRLDVPLSSRTPEQAVSGQRDLRMQPRSRPVIVDTGADFSAEGYD